MGAGPAARRAAWRWECGPETSGPDPVRAEQQHPKAVRPRGCREQKV